MLSTLEQDVRINYLLGELDQEAEAQIEERYFADNEYFEELVRLEEDLLSQAAQLSPSPSLPQTSDRATLKKIERLPETEFARQWLADVREIIAFPPPHGERFGPSGVVAEDSSDAVLVRALIDFYEAKLRQADLAVRQQETESILAAAWRDRELTSAIMEYGWLGLRILTALKPGGPLKASELAVLVGSHIDLITPVFVRLVQFGGIEEQDGLFAITERGSRVITNLEIATAPTL